MKKKIKKKKLEYNGWNGDWAIVAKQADRWTDKAILKYGSPTKQYDFLLFWGYMTGYKAAMRKQKK